MKKVVGQAGDSSKSKKKKPETDEVTSFTLVPVDHGKMPKAKAGQYVSVRVYVKKENLIQPRQYTVTDATKHSLRISVKKIVAEGNSPAGMVSNALHQDINQGTWSKFLSRQASSMFPEGNNPLCLISAGIGITPMLAMLKEAIAHNPQRQVTFVHICKEEKDYPLFDEVEALSKSGSVELVTCVTSKSGRPDEAFFTSLVKPNTEYLVCGPVGFHEGCNSSLGKG